MLAAVTSQRSLDSPLSLLVDRRHEGIHSFSFHTSAVKRHCVLRGRVRVSYY